MTVPNFVEHDLEVTTHYELFTHHMSSFCHNIHYSRYTLCIQFQGNRVTQCGRSKLSVRVTGSHSMQLR